MTTETTFRERFEQYAVANLNDGERPIPPLGRMVELYYAVDVLSDFVEEELVTQLKELRETTRMMKYQYLQTVHQDTMTRDLKESYNAALDDVMDVIEAQIKSAAPVT
jgi:hypothetical protein